MHLLLKVGLEAAHALLQSANGDVLVSQPAGLRLVLRQLARRLRGRRLHLRNPRRCVLHRGQRQTVSDNCNAQSNHQRLHASDNWPMYEASAHSMSCGGCTTSVRALRRSITEFPLLLG